MGNSDLPIAPARKHAKAFEYLGWVVQSKRGKGSHMLLTKPGHPAVLTIPDHGDVKRGTLGGLVRSAGLTIEEYCQAFRDC